MRLLRRDEEGRFVLTHNITNEAALPDYAILSHTWLGENDEVTFEDITRGFGQQDTESWAKIRFCGDQAARDGLQYFWVDTCCIDKSSSQELQEAITTMYQFYRNASRCYVHLADISVTQEQVGSEADSQTWRAAFRKSRWFSRGWTLQELLAPKSVVFYSTQGTRLGDKISLETDICQATDIPREALRGASPAQYGTDERLSWAENRRTTRKEDRAYSLLGIFSIFMPLMYGEGDHAFTRLREQINTVNAKFHKALLLLPVARHAAFNARQNENVACLPNTRVELLQTIADWVDGTHGSSVFWLDGLAGTGKSTVARTIARTYYDRGNLGASFFFTKKGGDGGDLGCADKVFTTLASQLASRIPATRRHISEAVDENPDVAMHSLRDQWDQLIISPLSKLDKTTSPLSIVFVVDALDECESEKDIRIILRLLASQPAFSSIRLRILITSRPEIPVRTGFSQIAEAERQTFCLHTMSATTVDRDLGLFFEHSLTMIREERGFPFDWPGIAIVRRLVNISCGLFIWASTACRFIREGRRFAKRRISMLINRHGTGTDPEKQLDEIYITVLRDSIQGGYYEDEKDSVYSTLRQVVGGIAILCTPLARSALATLIDLPSSDIDETLADLHTVLYLPAEKDRPIRLHHPTFREFITNKDRCRDPKLWVDEQQSHLEMADNCVRLMSKMLRRDICGLESPGTATKDVDPAVIEQCIPSELQYACCFWVEHYRRSKTSITDRSPARPFFQNHMLHWLEVMALIGKNAEIAQTLRIFESLLKPEESLNLNPFVHDTRRFFATYQSVIERTPLQAYCAALAFVPSYNEVRQHSLSQMRRWIRDVQIAEAVNVDAGRRQRKGNCFVNKLAFSPDGRNLASGGSTMAEIRLWDVGQKSSLGKFAHSNDEKDPGFSLGDNLPTDGMKCVAISPDGSLIASGSDDAFVTVWHFGTRQVQHTLTGHTGWVNGVAFSPDGKLLASGSMDETIRIWDLQTGKELHVLEGDLSCVNDVAFCPDSPTPLLVSGSADKVLRLWDVKLGEVQMLLDGHSGPVNSVRFSPDGKLIVSASDDATIKVWDTESGSEVKNLRGHRRKVSAVSFSPDGRLIASGSEDMTMRMWDANNGALLGTSSGHTTGVNAVAFSPDGAFLASASIDVTLRLWDARTGESLGHFEELEEDFIEPLSEEVQLIDLNGDYVPEEELKGHSAVVTCAKTSPDGKLISTASYDSTVYLWTPDGKRCQSLHGHSASVNNVAFSPDSSMIASASSDGTAVLWSTATGAELHKLHGHSDNVRNVHFSPDGQYLASCSNDKTAIVWHVRSGSAYARLEGHLDTVNNITFSPINSEQVATCSADGTARVWDLSTAATNATLKGHTDTVTSIAFSPDGSLLATASADHTIRLWSARGDEQATLKAHSLPVNDASFSPDGRLLVSCADDETVRIWDVASATLVTSVKCGVTVRRASFSSCGRHIETDRGTLELERSSDTASKIGLGCRLFASSQWVRSDGDDLLWLPEAYRATSVATCAETVVLGSAKGAVVFVSV